MCFGSSKQPFHLVVFLVPTTYVLVEKEISYVLLSGALVHITANCLFFHDVLNVSVK